MSSPSPAQAEEAKALREDVARTIRDGNFILSPDKLADAIVAKHIAPVIAERDEAQARAERLENDLDKITDGCPFDGTGRDTKHLDVTDPCPVCGDLGTFDLEAPSRCVANAHARKAWRSEDRGQAAAALARAQAAEDDNAALTRQLAAAKAEVEWLPSRLNTAMKRGIRAWSARLHVPVTRMMSRELRAEIHAALSATASEEKSDVQA